MRVFVTGNGSGIGKAVFDMFVAQRPTWEIHGTHTKSGERHVDLGDVAAVKGAMHYAKPVVLINNAGVLDEEPFGKLTPKGVWHVLGTNFGAAVACAQEAHNAGALRHIINVGSWYGETGSYGKKPIYAASKAALHNLTYSLARLLAPDTRVNCVAPGITDTPIHADPGKHADGRSLLGRMARAEEIAQVIFWLATTAPEYVNGAVIPVHGGR